MATLQGPLDGTLGCKQAGLVQWPTVRAQHRGVQELQCSRRTQPLARQGMGCEDGDEMANRPPEHCEAQKRENFGFYLPGPNLIYAFICPPIHLAVHRCTHPSGHPPTRPSTQHLRSILHSCTRERVSLALLGLGFYERSPTTQWKTATGCDGSRNRSHGNAEPGVHPPQAEKQEIEGDRGTICCLVQTFVTELPFSKAGNAVSTVHS